MSDGNKKYRPILRNKDKPTPPFSYLNKIPYPLVVKTLVQFLGEGEILSVHDLKQMNFNISIKQYERLFISCPKKKNVIV